MPATTQSAARMFKQGAMNLLSRDFEWWWWWVGGRAHLWELKVVFWEAKHPQFQVTNETPPETWPVGAHAHRNDRLAGI